MPSIEYLDKSGIESVIECQSKPVLDLLYDVLERKETYRNIFGIIREAVRQIDVGTEM